MKTYQVNSDIKHGTTEKDVKNYAPGEPIELDDVHAAPLLASGDISGPVDSAAKAKK